MKMCNMIIGSCIKANLQISKKGVLHFPMNKVPFKCCGVTESNAGDVRGQM